MRQFENVVNLNPFHASCYKKHLSVDVAEAEGIASLTITAVSLILVCSCRAAETQSLAIKLGRSEMYSDPAAAGSRRAAQLRLGAKWN